MGGGRDPASVASGPGSDLNKTTITLIKDEPNTVELKII